MVPEHKYIIITDSSPLMTLSKADELDVLLKQPLPIEIPDAVYRESTNPKYEDGRRIAEWAYEHQDRVHLTPTLAGLEQDALFRLGMPARHYGEIASIEAVNRFLDRSPENRAILLYEENGISNKAAIGSRAELVTTGMFLNTLERAGEISSAREILDKANAAGQNMQQQYPELAKAPQSFLTEHLKNMEPLQKAFPDQLQDFDFKMRLSDGVFSYEHRETHGRLRIDPEGHTRDRFGAVISPEKALESALSPQAEKANGIGKGNDRGPSLGM